jgi:hypothetical protein
MQTSSSVKRPDRRGGFAKERRPFAWSLAVIAGLGLAIIFVGWAVVGWPVLVAAAVAALVVRFF